MLENGVFKNLFGAKEIDLSNNMIDRLEEDTFIDCIFLWKLNLKSNMLHHLDSRLFIATEKLEYLNLGSNRLNKYQSFLFDNKALKILSMMDNPIQSYDANFIKALNEHRLQRFYYTEQFCKIVEITSASHMLIQNITCEKTSTKRYLTKESNGFKNI